MAEVSSDGRRFPGFGSASEADPGTDVAHGPAAGLRTEGGSKAARRLAEG
jgi:hypothetical protein